MLKLTVDFYSWCESFSDRRVEKWMLMSSPFPTLIILIFYLFIVYFGPKFMEKRKSLKLRFFLVIYNILITGLNGWIAFELWYCGQKRNYNFICQLVDTSDDIYEHRIASAIWWYYVSKGIEFMDTFFFILRKKNNQLSFLHVYHHSTMFAFWWVGAKFVPGGSALSGAMVNCFVHVIMYSYYALAALGDKVKSFLWWKKYLTILQLTQFSCGVVFGLHAILTNCQFTRWMQYFFVIYAFSFIVLFSNFYKTSYIEDNKNNKNHKNNQKIDKRIISKNKKLIKDHTKSEIRTMRLKATSLRQSQQNENKLEHIKKKYKKRN